MPCVTRRSALELQPDVQCLAIGVGSGVWVGTCDRDRRRLFLSLCLLVPVALAGAVQPLLVGQVISVIRGEASLPWLAALSMSAALRLLVWLLLGSVLLRFAFQRLQLFNIFSVGQRLTARIRQDLFSHSLALSLRFHDGMPVGKLLTRLTSDVDALAEVFASGAVGVIGDLVSLIVIATTMLLFDWRLGLFLLATQLPVTAVVLWFQRRYRKANYRVREELSQLNADFQENLQGLEVVQMFRREQVNGSRFARTGAAYRSAVNGTIFFDSSISAFLEWVSLGAVATVVAVGGWMVTRDQMGLGTLTTFILYGQRLFDPLRQLAERFTQIQGGLTAVERIGELLEQPLEITEADDARPLEGSGRGEVIFENVSFSYRPDEPILRNLSFRIAPGSMSLWSGRQVQANPRSFVSSVVFMNPRPVASFSTAAISGPFPSRIFVSSLAWSCRTHFCSAAMSLTTSD